ncbi:MAG: DUF4389 domain-containing protein [Syntrophobacteraceae bacterium]
MNDLMLETPSRRQIAIRLLYSIFFLLVLEMLKFLIQITVVFQYVYLLVTQTYSRPLKDFTNKLAAYTYRVIRYTTLNEHERPFPFKEFPRDAERPDEPVRFD